MPAVDVKIVHPRDWTPGGHAGTIFVFGTADPAPSDNSTVTGTITPKGGAGINNNTAAPPKVPSAYDWGLRFDTVPAKVLLRLVVTVTPTAAQAAAGYTPGTATRHFHVHQKPGYGPAITVDSPPSGGPVTSPFMVCGYVSPETSQMSASIQPSAGLQLPSMAVTPPPAPYDWAFEFTATPGNATVYIVAVATTGTTVQPWPVVVT